MSTPMLHVTSQITIRRRQSLPFPGKLLVRQGHSVNAGDAIAEGFYSPKHIMLDIAHGLDVPRRDTEKYLQCDEGTLVEAGDLIAGPAGFTKRIVRSPVDGKIKLIRNHVLILEVKADPDQLITHYPGEVIELIEDKGVIVQASGALIEGVWGNGGITHGRLRCLSADPVTEFEKIEAEYQQEEIIFLQICDSQATLETLVKKQIRGLIVCGLAPSLVSQALRVAFPILVLVGFGQVQIDGMIQKILWEHDGEKVTLSAEMWNRYAATRPEVFIPSPPPDETVAVREKVNLVPGQKVRITGSSNYGKVGTIENLQGSCVLSNGIRTEMAIVRFADDTKAQVPLANLIMIA